MLSRLSIASTLLAVSLISTGAFAQSIFPAFLDGAPAAQTVPPRAPGHNRYAPYEHIATPTTVVYASEPSASETAFYPEAASTIRRNEAHNHYSH